MKYFESNELKIGVRSINSIYLKNNTFIDENYRQIYMSEPKRMNKIKKYLNMMESGKWVTVENQINKGQNISPIIFFEDGNVWAGKHRMIALSLVKNYMDINFVSILGWNREDGGSEIYRSRGFKLFKKNAICLLIKNDMKDILLNKKVCFLS